MWDQAVHWLFDYPEPINVALIGNLAAATLNFVVSYSMDNSSWFDQYWAMAPVPIALYYAFNESSNWDISGTRKILALVAVSVWAIRLFSLFFVRVERKNDSGGTFLHCPLLLLFLLHTLLTTTLYCLLLQHLQVSLPMELSTKMHGTHPLMYFLSSTTPLLSDFPVFGTDTAFCTHFSYKQFRQQCGAFYWPASFVALHIIPALMLHWGCLPLYYVLSARNPYPTYAGDWAAFIFTIGAIILEATADQQLLEFTKKKMLDHTLVRNEHILALIFAIDTV